MDTYSEIVAALPDWVVNRPGAILMLSATLPLMLLLQKGRLLGYGALAVRVGAVAVMGYWAPSFLVWLLPVVAGLQLAPLLAVYSSRRSHGLGARRWRMFMTPEEGEDKTSRLPVT